MKSKGELTSLIERIASQDSPVGMDAVYVHALILDKLDQLERRLASIETAVEKQVAGKPSPGRRRFRPTIKVDSDE